MKPIYNLALNIVNRILLATGEMPFLLNKNSKTKKFILGQKQLLNHIENSMKSCTKPVVWIHAASLGEYGVARPIINRIKAESDCSVVLTFFSPTGVEALKTRKTNADYVFYLPLDTSSNASKFLDIVKPQKAVFIISEYWVNYLAELKNRGISTYLVSGLIKGTEAAFKRYGAIYKQAMGAFTKFFVLNSTSKELLHKLGFENVVVTGDPLFDNALTVANTAYRNEIVERWAGGKQVLVAGSISDENDLRLVCSLVAKHKDLKFLIVPHETTPDELEMVQRELPVNAMCYSKCDEKTDFSNVGALIIDYVGELAYLYRYGTWAYVGGGFTPLLHSVIEATVYGLPVSFGPEIDRKVTPQQLIEIGAGCLVRNEEDINRWLDGLMHEPSELEAIAMRAKDYAQACAGATQAVVKTILSDEK